MEYTVVKENNLDELIRKVTALIEQGWKPQGGIAAAIIAPIAKIYIFYQAMIKEQP